MLFLLFLLPGRAVMVFNRWPKPAGPYPVGTRVYHWVDHQREESFTSDSLDKREVIAQFWYPTKIAQSTKRAAYFLPVKTGNKSRQNLVLAFVFKYLNFFKTASYLDAPVLKGRFPLIVFFHGYRGFRGQNTLLMEHLASHGYVVVSLDSLYETGFVLFSNGRWEWSKTVLPDDYNSPAAEKLYQDWIDIRLADLKFLFKQIAVINSSAGFFRQIIDEKKTAVAGHSLGGMTAHKACRQDPRFLACVNLDAPLGEEELVSHYPPLLEVVAEETGDPPYFDAIFYKRLNRLLKNLTNIGLAVVVKDSGHYDFTDLAFIKLPIFDVFGAVGKISGAKINRLTNEVLLNFFDLTLKNKKTDYFEKKGWGNPDLIFLN